MIRRQRTTLESALLPLLLAALGTYLSCFVLSGSFNVLSIDFSCRIQALVIQDKSQFQHILRLLNTNVEGSRKIMYALTAIKGVGRRYSNLVCKKADVDLNKRWVPDVMGREPQIEPYCSLVPASCPTTSWSVLSRSSRTRGSTRSRTGSSTGKRTLSTASTRRSFPTVWTTSFVRTLRGFVVVCWIFWIVAWD